MGPTGVATRRPAPAPDLNAEKLRSPTSGVTVPASTNTAPLTQRQSGKRHSALRTASASPPIGFPAASSGPNLFSGNPRTLVLPPVKNRLSIGRLCAPPNGAASPSRPETANTVGGSHEKNQLVESSA